MATSNRVDSQPTSISDYATIGNSRSVALVSRGGAIDWLCWPQFDSGSLFGRLLDPNGGTWSVHPVEASRTVRTWVPETNILATRFHVGGGEVLLLDWMAVEGEHKRERHLHPEHALVRLIQCDAEPVELELVFDPKPDYGRSNAPLRESGVLGWRIEANHGLVTLRSSLPFQLRDRRARVRLEPGDRWILLLTYSSDAPATLPEVETFAMESFEHTTRVWRSWANRVKYEGPWRGEVVRSALAMKLLNFAPSGAIVAAATTSLPEKVGGPLNWDYRYTWLRDAALTVRALLSLGFQDEASAFMGWLLHSTRLTRPRLGVLYDVYGGVPKHEEILTHWSGFRGSRPVRIRNAAAGQLQLDVYGEVIDALAQLVRIGAPLDGQVRSMLRGFGEYICRHWDQPDASIWEPRVGWSHHTFSRVLSWVALERILELHALGEMPRIPRDRFRMNREMIRRDIEVRGWNRRIRAYTSLLDGDEVDASLLLMSWYGYAPAWTARQRATYERIMQRLHAGHGLLYRNEQSVREGEGAFGICGFWCSEFLSRGGGTLEEAERMFKACASYANDVGLFAEEYDPRTGEALGNFPQAFTHIGLISAALALEERRGEEVTRRPAPRSRHDQAPSSR